MKQVRAVRAQRRVAPLTGGPYSSAVVPTGLISTSSTTAAAPPPGAVVASSPASLPSPGEGAAPPVRMYTKYESRMSMLMRKSSSQYTTFVLQSGFLPSFQGSTFQTLRTGHSTSSSCGSGKGGLGMP